MTNWFSQHPEVLAAAWPFVLALVSAILNSLSSHPKVKAFSDLLSSTGVNPSGVTDAMTRLLTTPPAPPAAEEPKK